MIISHDRLCALDVTYKSVGWHMQAVNFRVPVTFATLLCAWERRRFYPEIRKNNRRIEGEFHCNRQIF